MQALAPPTIFAQVKVSPSVSHAMTPATGGIRYMNGALRAMPRTLLTHVHTSQPQKEQTTSAQKTILAALDLPEPPKYLDFTTSDAETGD